MFATFGRTWQLTKMSWGVLQSDRKLIAFPIMSGVALVILAALLTGVGAGVGTLDRLGGAGSGGPGRGGHRAAGITYFLLAFVIIYFTRVDRGRDGEAGRRDADAGRRVPAGELASAADRGLGADFGDGGIDPADPADQSAR